MDMSIPSKKKKKDSHHSLPGSISSLILLSALLSFARRESGVAGLDLCRAVIKTDALIASKLKEVSREYRERYVTSIRDML
jgi:hypothetical protein